MTKFIEQMKMKKLAKTIAGVTLGAVALGAMSTTPVYAAEGKLNGGSEKSATEYVGTGAVTISGASTGTELVNNMKIYGNTTGSSVTGSVTAANFASSGVTGLEIYGGWSNVAGVTGLNNKVLWESSATVGNIKTITGFYADAKDATATGTTVTLTGATVATGGEVYGDKITATKDATATGTTLKLTNTEIANDGKIYGAAVTATGTATATGTNLTLDKTKINYSPKEYYGAYVESTGGDATATGTTLTLTDTTKEDGHLYGAKVKGKTSATATGTTVNITGGSVSGVFRGVDVEVEDGATGVAEATGTTLTINGANLGKVWGAVVQGKKNGKANDTKVTITGGKLTDYLNAAEVHVNGGGSIGEANNTTLIISGTKIASEYAHIQGAEVSANAGREILSAKSTTVKLNLPDGSEMGNLTGVALKADYGVSTPVASATADTTEVEMTGGNVKDVIGAKIDYVETVETNKTSVTLNNVTATSVTGVHVASSGTTPIDTMTVTTNNTKLTINGTTVEGNVTGVLADSDRTAHTINATNTQVIFEGAASTVGGTVYGLNVNRTVTPNINASGTTLTIKNTGNKAGNIAGFDTINFVLPGNIKDDEAILTLTAAAATDLSETELSKAIDATRANLNGKDKVLLIDKTAGGALNLKDGTVGTKATLVANATTVKTGTYALGDDDNDLVLNISEGGEKPQEVVDNEKSFTETLAASVALLNSGADFATEQALGQAKAAAREGVKEGTREMMPFAAFGGSSMRYKSGSHIDAKGWNAALGFAKEQGELTYGIAVEHGQADFDSYVNAAHGEGKNKYTGGVIFAELKKKSGVHFDASFRAGRAENDYNANLSVLGISTPTSYDISATYLGFSLGGGKEMKVSETGTLDFYGRYYFNHLNGANAKTNSGIDIDFKDSDSSRLRLGTRYTQKVDEYNKLYAGLAWQYEFAGKAKAVVNGVDAPSPSLKGHSAMLELGIKTKAGKNLDIDLGLNGWVGKQSGIGGNIGFKWTF